MALLKSGRMVLIGTLVVFGLLVAACGPGDTQNPPPTTTPREAGDTLGLNGGITTLGTRPAGATGLGTRPVNTTGFAGIGAQQEEDVKTGTLVPREPVDTVFRDLPPEFAEQIDVERLVRWRQLIGFDETVVVTAPEGTRLPDVITYDEAEFKAILRDGDAVLELAIESDDEAPIVLELQEEGDGRYTYTFSEDSSDLTTIRIEGEDVRTLFEILTTGDTRNSITFEVELDYEIDGNSSIPEEAEFLFEFVTEFGFFEVEDDEEDVR